MTSHPTAWEIQPAYLSNRWAVGKEKVWRGKDSWRQSFSLIVSYFTFLKVFFFSTCACCYFVSEYCSQDSYYLFDLIEIYFLHWSGKNRIYCLYLSLDSNTQHTFILEIPRNRSLLCTSKFSTRSNVFVLSVINNVYDGIVKKRTNYLPYFMTGTK